MRKEIELANDLDDLTARFVESAPDAMPSTTQPKSRAIGTRPDFPTSAVCTTATHREAAAIARYANPHMTTPLSVSRIEEILTTPPGHYSSLMAEQSRRLLQAVLQSASVAWQRLEFATVTGAQSARKDNDQ